jgi:hypothetical protein
MQAEARGACSPMLASAGARAFLDEYSEGAASPALSHAFAQRQQARQVGPRPQNPWSSQEVQDTWKKTFLPSSKKGWKPACLTRRARS